MAIIYVSVMFRYLSATQKQINKKIYLKKIPIQYSGHTTYNKQLLIIFLMKLFMI